MVAPRPQEPLVLYLAATPYSASAALVAVREERRIRTAAAARDKAKQEQGRPTETATAAEEDQLPQRSAPEAEEAPPLGRSSPSHLPQELRPVARPQEHACS